MFEESFSLMFAKDNVDKDDISYITGHCLWTICFKEEYCINEKNAVRLIEGYNKKSRDYKVRIDQIVTFISYNPDKTREGVKGYMTLFWKQKLKQYRVKEK